MKICLFSFFITWSVWAQSRWIDLNIPLDQNNDPHMRHEWRDEFPQGPGSVTFYAKWINYNAYQDGSGYEINSYRSISSTPAFPECERQYLFDLYPYRDGGQFDLTVIYIQMNHLKCKAMYDYLVKNKSLTLFIKRTYQRDTFERTDIRMSVWF